jgi:hypothetical protein
MASELRFPQKEHDIRMQDVDTDRWAYGGAEDKCVETIHVVVSVLQRL